MEQLSSNCRYACQRMWRLGYGVLRGLHVRDGDLLLDPPFAVVRTVRFPETSPTQRRASAFPLKQEHLAFQREVASIGNGVIDIIKVHDGLPVGLEIQEQL